MLAAWEREDLLLYWLYSKVAMATPLQELDPQTISGSQFCGSFTQGNAYLSVFLNYVEDVEPCVWRKMEGFEFGVLLSCF